MVPLFTGVLIVLVFSLPGLRQANGALCLGIALGGFVAAWVEAKANGNRLETTRGLLVGARVGVVASIVVLLLQLVISWLSLKTTLDPIPNYIYAAIYGIYDGLIDEIIRSKADGVVMPGKTAQTFIMLVSAVLFGGFGGGVAASTFVRQPAIDSGREESADAIRMKAYRSWQSGVTERPPESATLSPIVRPAPVATVAPVEQRRSAALQRPQAPLSVEPPPTRRREEERRVDG